LFIKYAEEETVLREAVGLVFERLRDVALFSMPSSVVSDND